MIFLICVEFIFLPFCKIIFDVMVNFFKFTFTISEHIVVIIILLDFYFLKLKNSKINIIHKKQADKQSVGKIEWLTLISPKPAFNLVGRELAPFSFGKERLPSLHRPRVSGFLDKFAAKLQIFKGKPNRKELFFSLQFALRNACPITKFE